MSFGYSVGDFIAVGTLIWRLYKTTKDAPDSFQNIHLELQSMHAVVKEAEETIFQAPLAKARQARLIAIGESCSSVLADLDKIILKYDSLGAQSKRTWDRMRWSAEEIAEIRARMTSSTTMLTAFITTSQAVVHQKLNKFMEDFQQGRREGSVVSEQTVDSLNQDNRAVWRTIRKELEEIGITISAFEANREFIFNWFIESAGSGAFEECESPSGQDLWGLAPVAESRSQNSDQLSTDGTSSTNALIQAPLAAPDLTDSALYVHTRSSLDGAVAGCEAPSTRLAVSTRASRNVSHSPLRQNKSNPPPRISRFLAAVSGRRLISAATNVKSYSAVRNILCNQSATCPITQKYLDIALWKASMRSKSINTIRMLLDAGADVNAVDENGDSILLRYLKFLPIRGSYWNILDLLLARGADSNFVNSKISSNFGLESSWRQWLGEDSAVAYCVQRSAIIPTDRGTSIKAVVIEVIRRLLQAGANSNGMTGGMTLLQYAIVQCNDEAFELLLAFGANVDERGSIDKSPLTLATQYGNIKILMLLAERKGITNLGEILGLALISSLQRNATNLALRLIEAGADVRLEDPDTPGPGPSWAEFRRVAIDMAVWMGNDKVMGLLIGKGALRDALHGEHLKESNRRLCFNQQDPEVLKSRKLIRLELERPWRT